MRAALLHMQFRSMRATYAETYKAARFEIVELDAKPVGRIVTDVSHERVLFVDIALLPEVQRGGLATALMTALLDEPRRRGIPADVTVLCYERGVPAALRAPGIRGGWPSFPIPSAPLAGTQRLNANVT